MMPLSQIPPLVLRALQALHHYAVIYPIFERYEQARMRGRAMGIVEHDRILTGRAAP